MSNRYAARLAWTLSELVMLLLGPGRLLWSSEAQFLRSPDSFSRILRDAHGKGVSR